MKKIQDLQIGIVGATGAVGREIIQTLEERQLFPKSLRLAASANSAGETLDFRQKPIRVEELTEDFFKGIDVAICSAGSAVSQKFVQPKILGSTIAIDNCSYHRMDPEVPLVVPEVNSFDLDQRPKKSIIANPNCTTIGMLVPLAAIHQHYPITRIVCSSYQSVSGAGQKGIEELGTQVQAMFQSQEPEPGLFPKRIAFNLIPNIGGIEKDGHTSEELKMVNETRKMLGDSTIQVAATCVRVPTFLGHGLSMYVEVSDPIDLKEAADILSSAPGVKYLTGTEYPVLTDCQGVDSVFVGRLRAGTTANSFQLWCVSDNLRKGAALNAVQILETIMTKDWL